MSEQVARLLREHFEEVIDTGVQRTRGEITQYRSVTAEQLRASVTAGFRSVLADLEDPPYRQYRKVFGEISYKRARQGFEVMNLNAVVDLTEDILFRLIVRFIAEPSQQVAAVVACHGVCGSGRMGIMESFGRSNQEYLAEANQLIDQLSSPLLPLYPGIIVLPLIGALNAQRSQRILEALLNGVVSYRAKVVVIDITGAAELTTESVSALVSAARATELLGSRIIIAGVTVTAAKALLDSTAALTRVTTVTNLQAALEHAFRERGLTIAPIKNA